MIATGCIVALDIQAHEARVIPSLGLYKIMVEYKSTKQSVNHFGTTKLFSYDRKY